MNDLKICPFCLVAPARISQSKSNTLYKSCRACESPKAVSHGGAKVHHTSEIRTNSEGQIISWCFRTDTWDETIPGYDGALGAFSCQEVRSYAKKNTFEVYTDEETIERSGYFGLFVHSDISFREQARRLMSEATGKVQTL